MNDAPELTPELTPEERAAARGADMFAPLGDGEQLNVLDTVDGVLRQFIGEVVTTRSAYHADVLTGDQAGANVAKLAAKYAAIFMGKSKDFAPLPWNKPEQLGVYLQGILSEPATPEDACEKFLARMAADFVTNICAPLEEQTLTDDNAQFRLAVLIEDCAYALLGLPNTGTDD
jgi:hypothetical protein